MNKNLFDFVFKHYLFKFEFWLYGGCNRSPYCNNLIVNAFNPTGSSHARNNSNALESLRYAACV